MSRKVAKKYPRNLLYVGFLILVSVLFVLFYYIKKPTLENMESNKTPLDSYIQEFKEKENRIFPFRYFEDEKGTILPFVAVTGPFRGVDALNKYNEYKKKGVHIFGITAYKSFPRIIIDGTENKYEIVDQFDYVSEIKNWCTCFKNNSEFGFTHDNHTFELSESDFYDADDKDPVPKKYDFIYICNKDNDKCPLNGWNAINRNFNFALAVFPTMIKKNGLKGLIVGRVGCGLEEEYGDQIEITDFLPWGELQDKMRESRFLFLPNVNDASPRVIAECMTKDLPVLMNENILGGWKYITPETGEFFSNEYDFEDALNRLLDKLENISPKEWWKNNYSQAESRIKLRNFLEKSFPGSLTDVSGVKFIL
jgi:hypothetical protein